MNLIPCSEIKLCLNHPEMKKKNYYIALLLALGFSYMSCLSDWVYTYISLPLYKNDCLGGCSMPAYVCIPKPFNRLRWNFAELLSHVGEHLGEMGGRGRWGPFPHHSRTLRWRLRVTKALSVGTTLSKSSMTLKRVCSWKRCNLCTQRACPDRHKVKRRECLYDTFVC